ASCRGTKIFVALMVTRYGTSRRSLRRRISDATSVTPKARCGWDALRDHQKSADFAASVARAADRACGRDAMQQNARHPGDRTLRRGARTVTGLGGPCPTVLASGSNPTGAQ